MKRKILALIFIIILIFVMIIYKNKLEAKSTIIHFFNSIENKKILDIENRGLELKESMIKRKTNDLKFNNYLNERIPNNNNVFLAEGINLYVYIDSFKNSVYQLENYLFFDFIKPLAVKKSIALINDKKLNYFDFFIPLNNKDFEKLRFNNCTEFGVCTGYGSEIIIYDINNIKETVKGSVSNDAYSYYFEINEFGEVFVFNEKDKHGGERPYLVTREVADMLSEGWCDTVAL